MKPFFERLGRIGIIPVVVLDDEALAEPLANALLAGGIPTMEITFRTGAALGAIERVASHLPGMLVGAGTVLTVDQAKVAIGSGAKYIVSPGLNRGVVEECLSRGVPAMPGAVTPTEIGAAIDLGLEVLKFFPAEAIGGVRYLEAIGAVYHDVKFVPTGGINEKNLLSYLRNPSVLACGGSWMVKKELITAMRFDEVERISRLAVALMQDARRREGAGDEPQQSTP